MPRELEEEIHPEFWDEPIFNQFFEIYQKGQEFYQTIYYYQEVMGFEFNGEELSVLLILWNHANHILSEKEKKKSVKKNTGKRGGHVPKTRRR